MVGLRAIAMGFAYLIFDFDDDLVVDQESSNVERTAFGALCDSMTDGILYDWL
jgi:hypothetical protein